MTAAKRAMSILLSATMLMGNLVSPMTAFAGETGTEENEAYEAPVSETGAEQPVTEAPDYLVSIPYYEEAAFMVDENHVKKREDGKETVLTYKAGDDVKITVSQREGFELEEIRLLDDKKNEQGYTWEKEDTFVFLMPEKDLKVKASFRELPVEAETAAAAAESNEAAEDTPVADKSPALSEDPAMDDNTASEDVQGDENADGAEPASQAEASSDNEETGAAAETGTDMSNSQVEETAESKDLQIPAIDPETEADGYPVGGSIVRLGEISINAQDSEYDTEFTFDDAPYPQDTCRYELKSSSVQDGIPGLYEMIYRVDESTTGRFWYVVRPVRVLENAGQTDAAGAVRSDDESEQDSEDDGEDHIETEEDTSAALESILAPAEEETEAVSEAMSEEPGSESLEDTEEMTEAIETETEAESDEASDEKNSHTVHIPDSESYVVTLDHEDGSYASGETVWFSVTSPADVYISSVAAQLSGTVSDEETSERNYLDMTYQEDEGGYTFVMPDEDVDIVVTITDGPEAEEAVQISEEAIDMPMMLLAAAASDDDDEDWDDATEIEANKYYFTRKSGTYSLSSSLVNQQSNDHMKNVRYSVDGVAKKVQAFCLQSTLPAPPSNTTYKNYVDLDGGGDEKLLRKGLFSMYGGPAFGDTISGINIKTQMTNGGCSNNTDYYGITHYTLGYIYTDSFGGYLSDKAKTLIKNIIANLKKLPDPGNVELDPLSGEGTYSAADGCYKTGNFKFKGYSENPATIKLENGVTLHNVTQGTTGTGSVTVSAGDTFYLTAAAGTGTVYSGKYSVSTKYPVDYHACALKFSGYQDIGFAYYTGGAIKFSVDWPKEAIVKIVKKDSSTGVTLAGAVYGLYSDAACTNLVAQFPPTDANGASQVIIPATQTTMYVKEISAPNGYYRNQTAYPVSTLAGVTTNQEVKDDRVKATIRLVKKDKETGSTPQGDATFEGAVYGLYAKAAINHPDGKTGTVYAADAQVGTFRIDKAGNASLSDLYLGSYYIKELTPPVGYLIDPDTHDVTCSYEGDMVAVVERTAESSETVKKQPFQIIKAGNDGETTDAPLLKGTGFSVYLISALIKNADGSYNFDAATPIVVNEDGSRELFTDERGYAKSIPIPYGKYIVKETTTPHNFNPVDDFMVTVTENLPDTPQVWRVLLDEQFKAKLKIIKKDDETKKPVLLPNTEFKVFDVTNDCYVEQVTTYPFPVKHISYFTDEDGYLILADPLPLGEYRIEEVNAPEGYTINTDGVPVTVDQNTAHLIEEMSGDVMIEVILENHPVKGELTVYKEGEVLIGYNGKEFTWEMQKLKGASFEVRAAEDIFTPDHQKDADGNRLIVYSKGELVDTITTGDDGMAVLKDIPLGSYEVREKDAPYGYTLNAEPQGVSFNYVDQNTPLISKELTFSNERQKVSITTRKLDEETKVPVAGAVFGLYTGEDIMLGEKVLVEKDTLLQEMESGEDGNASFTLDVPLGSYCVKEIKAPDGYYSSDEVISYDASYRGQDIPVVELTADKKNKPTEVDITKSDITTGVELDGATLKVLDDKGNEIETWTSVKNEPHVIKRLLIGKTYHLREEFAPYGYLVANEIEFTIADDGKPVKVDMKDEVPIARLLINKKGEFLDKITMLDNLKGTVEFFFDYISGNLKPVTFEVYAAEDIKAADGESEDYYKKDELVATITTDDDGIAMADNLPVGKYYVKEVETAYGYVLDDEIRYVDLSYRDQNTPVVTYDETWQNARQKVAVSVLKNEKDTERPLKGGVFGLYSREDILSQTTGDVLLKKDALIELKTTDENGLIRFIADLPIDGKYYVKELHAPAGFVCTYEVKDFTASYEGQDLISVSYDFIFEDEPTTVEITKSILTTGEELEGAHLTVTNSLGEVIDEWVSGKEPHVIKELVVGQIYTLTETKPADGYATAESVDFVIGETAEVQKVEMKDDVTKLEITKSDITSGEPVIGAELTITDADGNEVAKWTTTKEPYYIEMLPIGTYTLTEVTTPDGYATAETITFEVKDTAEIQKVDMKDAPITVEISKKDIVEGENGQELAGAKLEVKDADGNVIESWVSGQEPHKIPLLKPGKYTLTEVTAPKGYEVAEKVEFEVKDTGEIQKVTMYDSPKEETVDLTGKKKTTTTGGGYTPGPGGSTSVVTPPVKTGDDTPIMLWVLLAALGLFTGGLAISLKKKGRIV